MRWTILALAAAMAVSLGGCAGGKNSGAAAPQVSSLRPLSGTSWRLVSVEHHGAGQWVGQRVWTPRAPVELSFSSDGTALTGRSICHALAGSARVGASEITIGLAKSQLASPRLCMGEEVAQEQEFYNDMDRLQSYQRRGDRLVLISADRTEWTFAQLP